MFSLKDFPIGSYLYWIRRVSYNNITQAVYTRYQVTGHGDNGDLYSDVYPENLDVQLTQPGKQLLKKDSGGFTIIHSKDKYLYANGSDILVPELVYNIFHNPEVEPKTPMESLQKLLGLGLGVTDNLIKEATLSFEKWNEDKKLKIAQKIFRRKIESLQEGESATVILHAPNPNKPGDPPYGT